MAAVKVAEADKAFLAELVAAGLAATLSGAVTYVCNLARASRAKEKEENGREERGGKRERVAVGSDERIRREAVSEPALGELWQGMTEMKHATAEPLETEALNEALSSGLFPCEWGSLLLQLEDNPARGLLSRLDAARFLLTGWRATQRLRQERLVAELIGLNRTMETWVVSGLGVDILAVDFVQVCPILNELFGDLVTAETRVDKNGTKTPDFKRAVFVILFVALGKVRSMHQSAGAKFLYRLWRELGAPNAVIDCLATLGLSISSKRGSDYLAKQIGKAARKLKHHTEKAGAGELFFASCDNVDESFKSRAQQVGCRDESLHFINSTLYRFKCPVPPNLARDCLRNDQVDISALFASPQSEAAILDLCVDNLARILHPLLKGFSFEGKPLKFGVEPVAPRLVSLGMSEKTEMHPLPTQNFSESNLGEFFTYENLFLERFRRGEKVLVTADAKTYLLMKKTQKLRNQQRNQHADCDDSAAIPVPDWFHLSMCVFLGDCTRNNLALLRDFCTLMGSTYVINASVSKSFNESMRVFNALYPVAVARLFGYFLTNVAGSCGIIPSKSEFVAFVRQFAFWIVYTTKMLKADGQPLLEYQRHCRLVLVLAVYNVTWDATRSANHDALMDVMHWILPIVCQGPFSQYRSVVVDSLAYYHRASEVERFLYKQSFTVNPTGAALGNTATGKNQVGCCGGCARRVWFHSLPGILEQENEAGKAARSDTRRASGCRDSPSAGRLRDRGATATNLCALD